MYLEEGEKESNSQAKPDRKQPSQHCLLNERAGKFLLHLGLTKLFSQMPGINKKLFLIQFGLQF